MTTTTVYAAARHVDFKETFSPDIAFRADAYPHWAHSKPQPGKITVHKAH